MLSDKTEFFNRLENSNFSVKSNGFGQPIKNPYMAQYKIFQERLKHPKAKSMSMILNKRKKLQKIGKQNLQSQIRLFEQEQCLKQARKVVNNQKNKFTVFSNNTIDYDINETSKQSQVLMKFKQKLQQLKTIKNQLNFYQKNRVLSVNLTHLGKYSKSQIRSSVGSQRKIIKDIKPNTADVFTQNRMRTVLISHKFSNNNVTQNKIKLPLSFVAYKKNKSFAQKFTKNKR